MNGTDMGLPRKAHRLVLSLDAHDRDVLVAMLERISARIAAGEFPETPGLSSSPDGSFHHCYLRDEDQTRDRYFEALEAWLTRRVEEAD